MVRALHAVIISWDGYTDRARAIASELESAVERLTVIYSNTEGIHENGPGIWIQVPQSWYFGRKFATALKQMAPHEIQLQVQADVTYHDWPELAASCVRAYAENSYIGIWGPDLDWTPWPLELVDEGPLSNSKTLRRVAQSDGVVWALGPEVMTELKKLDYSANNLGWGIDWVAANAARRAGYYVVRDTQHLVHHPESRGYHGGAAGQQMKRFLGQLPWLDQSRIRGLQDLLQSQKTHASVEILKSRPELAVSQIVSSENFITMASNTPPEAKLSHITMCDQTIYALAGANFLGCAPAIVTGAQELSFRQLSEHPSISLLARNFPIEACEPRQQVGKLGEWEVPGWRTLRLILDHEVGPQRIPLGGALTLAPEDGPLDLLVDLACHRGRARLVAVLTDIKGRRIIERVVTFEGRAEGGTQPNAYQTVRLSLPAYGSPQTLTLEVDYLGSGKEGTSEPNVFFVARPRVTAQGSNQLLAPFSVTVDPISTGDTWYKAELGSSAKAGNGINLSLGKTNVALLAPDNTRIQLLHDWGHVLEFESNAARECVAWINGQPELAVSMETGHNTVRIPQNLLLGGTVKFELRDSAGMIIYWHDWLLLPRQVTPTETLQNEGKAPLDSDLFPQTPLRFEAFRAHIAAGASPEKMAQLTLALDALEAGHEKLKLKPLSFAPVEEPDVSIIIPAHNKFKVTYAGLCGLLLAWNEASFEVILVDDASTDETAEIESIVEGITVVRNEEPQRFIRACNAGAEKARGKYVVLLNNDTEPTVGWLDELIATFKRFPDVGLTGAKLLYPDGKLQDAGGIIWGTGDPWNYGNRQNPWEPRFSYARKADYLSGAAMMTTREIWNEVGGLSNYLEPMYFEDTDFAFKVREAGYSTWFVPSAIVYHYEGLTSGTNTSSGFKRFQEVNRPKFKRRWAQAFVGGSKPGTLPDLEKDRDITGRVLFIDYTTPTPDQNAGSYAALEEIRLVQSLGYKVTFLPENLAYFGRYTSDLQKMGVEVITAPFYTSIQDFLQERGAEFDAFYITRYHVVNNAVPLIRAINPDAKVIMNNADLHYLRLLRKAIADNDDAQKETARTVRDAEFNAMRSVDLVLSYNDMEHAVIEAQSEGEVKVMPCPWVLDLPEEVMGREERSGLSFLGGFQHHPNVEGIEWFAHSVMSRLENTRSDIVLSIYGSRMSDRVSALATSSIDPVGFVEDVADAYDRHMVFVAPLLSGAGIKGKVLSALAHGIPCVLSPLAAEGIGLVDGRDCLIARTSTDWEDAILRLYDNSTLWQKLSENGRELARSRFSFEKGRDMMQAALEEVDLFGHAPR